MKIGITGPISTESVAHLLTTDIATLPKGCAGAPLLGTLITSLLEKGHKVSAYTLDRGLAARTTEPVMVEGLAGFRIFYGPYRPHSIRWNGRRLGRILDLFRVERIALQRAIERDRPDIVHAHWTYEFALAAIASGVPHVVTCHDSPRQVLRHIPSLYRLGRYVMARRVFATAKVLSAVSPYLVREVSKYVDIPIAVVPNPFPDALVTNTKTTNNALSRSTTPKLAMILNGWGTHKNATAGLVAFSLVRQAIAGATLHLYGHDFGEGQAAHKWARRRSIDNGMNFHDMIPNRELMLQLRSCDLLLHPALEEACPMALVEAMALGVPVVGGTHSGGVPWVLDYGNAGVLTDVHDPVCMSRDILGLLNDPERYHRISSAAIQRAHLEFSASSVAERYLSLYCQVLAKVNRPRFSDESRV